MNIKITLLVLSIGLSILHSQPWKQQHQGKVLFEADFSTTADVSTWHQHGGKPGQWSVKDGKLVSGPEHTGWLTLPASVHAKNVAIQADIRIVSAKEPARWVSVFARQNDPEKQLFTQMPMRQNLSTEIADSLLFKGEKPYISWHVYIVKRLYDKKPNDAIRTFRLECRDNLVTTFMDGKFLCMSQVAPDNIMDGHLGIMVSNVSVEIERIRVEEIEGKTEEEIQYLRELEVGRPLVVGHRGNSAEYPENTLASYLGAVGTGADAVEIDLRLSTDGIPYSFHDDTLDRTTTGTGPVNQCTMAQLKAVDAGIKRDPKFAGERIPTFEEIIQATRGKLGILIDLKEPRAIPVMCDLMKRYDIVETTIIATWGEQNIKQIRELLPNATVILLTSVLNGEQQTFDRLHAAGFDGVFVQLVLPLSFPTLRPRRKAMTTFVWTVNSPEGVTAAWKLGVDGIITDNPRMVRAKVNELSDKIREW